LALKGIAHTQYIAHSLAEGLIAFELGIGIDVCMYFHIHIILAEQVTELEGYLNTAWPLLPAFAP
jgi:hypothetical protein